VDLLVGQVASGVEYRSADNPLTWGRMNHILRAAFILVALTSTGCTTGEVDRSTVDWLSVDGVRRLRVDPTNRSVPPQA
jgi:hypothetical protein